VTRAPLAVVVALGLAGAPRPADAQPGAQAGDSPAALLGAAHDALAAGDHATAARLAERVVGATALAERTEALRVLGLSRFFLGQRAAAEGAFVELLVLDADAHLDPALVPPEAIVFFEDVRARRAPELAARRPPPPRRRIPWLAPLPIFGQVQNGDRTKAWLIGGAGATLLAINLGTYAWLRQHCDRETGLCHDATAGADDAAGDLTGRARTMQGINLAAGVGLVGLAIYAAVDGVLGYRADSRSGAVELGGTATPDGGFSLVLGGRF
jgi:hypothetical protein